VIDREKEIGLHDASVLFFNQSRRLLYKNCAKKICKKFFFFYTEKENSVECIKRQVKKNNVDDCHWGERA
jgi:hypothetical protein